MGHAHLSGNNHYYRFIAGYNRHRDMALPFVDSAIRTYVYNDKTFTEIF